MQCLAEKVVEMRGLAPRSLLVKRWLSIMLSLHLIVVRRCVQTRSAIPEVLSSVFGAYRTRTRFPT